MQRIAPPLGYKIPGGNPKITDEASIRAIAVSMTSSEDWYRQTALATLAEVIVMLESNGFEIYDE